MIALPAFVLLHGAITAAMVMRPFPLGIDLSCHTILLVGAIGFWLPVLTGTRLSPAGRCLYLFVAGPTLDIAGVFAVIVGDPAGGLAMIVAMLPIGFITVAQTWSWIQQEEIDQALARPS